MEENTKHKHIKLQIGNREYEVSLYLSVKDIMSIIKELDESNKEYNLLVATIITNHFVKQDSALAKEIVATDTAALSIYIQELVEEDAKLRKSYVKHANISDICLRFVLSVRDMWNEMSRFVIDQISQISAPLALDIGRTTLAIPNQIEKTLSAFEKIVKASIPKITTTVSIIQQAMEPINRISKIVGELTAGFASQLSSIYDQIKLPNITEEHKEELRLSFETWGKFGWTLMPHADITVFNEAPSNIKDSNERIKAWCTKEDMETLFEGFLYVKGANKRDLEEAVNLYRTRQYKSCAMILFSLLDAKLIRMQRKEDRDPKNKRRSSGASAIRKIKKHVEAEQDINKKFFLLLSYTNLFACIETLFEDAKDFKKQPILINRNFLQHGMLTRKVKKRDCIQLFLLYYNFLEFFEIISE